MAEALGQSIAGAADRTNGLARAWNAVWNSASNVWYALGKAVAGQITLEERLANLITARRQAEGRRSRSALTDYEPGISDIQEQIRRRNQQADRDARTARERSASTGALAVVDELNPFGAELRKLETMAAALEKGLREAGSALDPDQMRQVAENAERLQRAIQGALTPAERQRQINELTVQEISARTVAERTSVEIARIQIDSAFKLKDSEEQRLIILGKINEMQAQANREAKDALRSSADQARLAGLRPYQRRELESQFRYRDNVERFGGSSAGATGASREQLLNAIEKTESGGRNVPNYKFGPGFTAQGHFQITNSTWKDIAKAAGVNLEQYPNAMSAPYEVQRKAASALIDQRGVQPWAPHNPALRSWLGGNGGAAGDNAAKTIAENDNLINSTEAYNSIIRSANDNLAAQQRQLEATRATMFASSEEVAKAQKFQELWTQAVNEGGTALAERLRPEIEKTAAGYGALARQREQYAKLQESLKTIGDLGRNVIGGMVSDLRSGASGAEIFRNALDKIASKLLDMALNDLFGKAFGNNAMGLFGNGGGGGFFGSLFGGFGGGGSGLGLTPGSGGLYANGGYTGPGGKHEPAGIVHRGEVVWSQYDVARAGGVAAVEGMRRGGGFANGGYTGPAATVPAYHTAANSNRSSGVNVQVINKTSGAVEGTATTTQNPDGSVDVMIDLIEARMADNVTRGTGTLGMAMGARASGRQLRG